jgi:hypothetical protein
MAGKEVSISTEKPIKLARAGLGSSFHNVPLPKSCMQDKPIFLEICCGSAKLSLHMRMRGFQVLPVDWMQNKHESRLPFVKIDLLCPLQASILEDLIDKGDILFVWAAVPCGTCSRAREIPLPGGPRPLRSESFPEGLPNLRPADFERVQKANLIYAHVARILQRVIDRGGYVAVENPKNSYLWLLPWYKELINVEGFSDTEFQHCRWNPELPGRPKWTKIRSNVPQLGRMAGRCTLGHVHLPWGRDAAGNFATAGESEYPSGMAEETSHCFAAAAQQKGLNLIEQEQFESIQHSVPHRKRRAVAAKQPRGRILPPVMSEFRHTEYMSLDEARAQGARVLRMVLPRILKMGVRPFLRQLVFCRQLKLNPKIWLTYQETHKCWQVFTERQRSFSNKLKQRCIP